MSKLTCTNSPKSSSVRYCVISLKIYCGGYSSEDPPLPIPNREVKLANADGTAIPSGRVGSCRFFSKRLESSDPGLFFTIFACPVKPFASDLNMISKYSYDVATNFLKIASNLIIP